VRLFNGFGYRQRADSEYGAVIPRFLHAAMNGNTIQIYGDGEQTRDFIYIDDIVSALLMLMESDCSGVINLATGKETSVLRLANMVMNIGAGEIEMEFRESRKGEVARSLADISRITGIGFVPKFALEEGLMRTFEAMRDGRP